jgi:hypothetical protein
MYPAMNLLMNSYKAGKKVATFVRSGYQMAQEVKIDLLFLCMTS